MRRSNWFSGLLNLVIMCAWLPSMAVQTLTFNGVSTVLSTGTETLAAPVGIAVDSSFNAYVSDTNGSQGRITKIAQNGTSSVLAITGLTLSAAPKQIAIDGSGNLYIADAGNSLIVVVNPTTGVASALSTGSITLSAPQGVAIDAAGDVLIADTGNNRIVEVPAGGTAAVYTITSLTPSLSSPKGLAIDPSGNLYIADFGHTRVVKVTPQGAGTGSGAALTITGTSPMAPADVAVDSFGNLYVADSSGGRIIAVSTALAGTNFSSAHTLTNTSPAGVAVDLYGNVYVADTGNNAIDQVQINAIGFGHNQLGITTYKDYQLVIGSTAGPDLTNLTVPTFGKVSLDFTTGGYTTCSAGTANQSTCIIDVDYKPVVAGYRQGAMILTYIDNSITPQQTRSLTVPLYAFSDAPLAAVYSGISSVIGASNTVPTQDPYQIAIDGSGNVYVGNKTGDNVVEIPASGNPSVLSTTSGTTSITLGSVNGVAVDGAGDRLIADNGNSVIVEVSPNANVYQLSIDVGATPVTLSGPTALAVDGGGDLFIADSGNNRILKVALKDPSLSTTFPLSAIVVNTGGYTFNGITGLAVDSQQNLYVVDSANSRIVKITARGTSSIVSFPGLTLSTPEGVAVDGMGNVYVTDTGNSRIIQLTTDGVASVIPISLTLGGGSGQHLYGVAVDPSGNIYIADSSNNRVVKVSVTSGSFAFSSTFDGSTSAAMTAAVVDIGDQALSFSAGPTYPTGYIANASATNACTSSTSLAPGSSCNVSAEFAPTTPGAHSANITFSDNSLNATNGSTQLIAVTGTSSVAGDSTSTTVSVNPSPTAIGQATTITVTVADTTTGTTTPTGSVTIVDTIGSTTTTLNNNAPVSLSGGVATLPNVLLLGVGTHTITATYGGVANTFLVSTSTPASVAVGKGTPTVTVTASPTSASIGQSVTFSITVASPSVTPTGTVQLLSGSTVLGSSSLNGSGVASIATSSLPAGMDAITVQYSGDSNYAAASGSVSDTVNKIAATVTLAASSTTANVGQAVTFTVTVSSSGVTPTGTVQLVSGSTVLGDASLDSTGKASITTSSLQAGMDTVTVQYSGDSTYAAATASVTETETGAGFAVVGPASTTESARELTPLSLTFQPTGGFTGTVTFSCTGLPAQLACSFAPATVVADGTDTSVAVTLTLVSQTAQSGVPGGSTTLRVASVWLPGLDSQPAMACAVESRRGRRPRRRAPNAPTGRAGRGRMGAAWAVTGMLFTMGFLSACSTHNSPASETYSIKVIATATDTASGYQGPSVSTTLLSITLKY